MTTWLWILGSIYIAILAYAAYTSWRQTEDADDYILAGSNIGAMVGLLTYAATLFSTFTLMGMPDFFRVHGIGAWIFLGVSDGVQVFIIVWFGYYLRKRAKRLGFRGTAGLLTALYKNRWAGYLYFLGVFLFLVPYVAIQIRGLAIFMEAVFPGLLPAWVWSAAIVIIMLIYSEVGGLRAIIYSDIMQGLTLLLATWIIAVLVINSFGGIGEMFAQVREVNPDLLSIPGPQGLFSRQFLFISLISILFLPITQPHLTTRLMVMRDDDNMNRMAVAIGGFAIMIILPVIAIGLYGSIHYADATTREFLSAALLFDQPDFIAAAVVVGLLTAAMSTADSQIFALGTELRSLLEGEEETMMLWTRGAIVFFGLAALVFSIVSSDQLVLLALASFRGTMVLGPMILAGILLKNPPGTEVVVVTAIGLAVFVASLGGVVPEMLGPIRLDIVLIIFLSFFTLGSALVRGRTDKMPVTPE